MATALAGHPQIAAFLAREAWRRTRRRVRVGPLYGWRYRGGAPDRLTFVPPELRASDPLVARDLYAGHFLFAGRLLECSERSPFQAVPPSRAFAAELHGFAWLRHLSEAGDRLAAHNARAFVEDWLGHTRFSASGLPYAPEVTARRIVAWITHSGIILAEADRGFRRRFMKGLSRQIRYLRSIAGEAPDGLPRLQARIALAFASLCLPAGPRVLKIAASRLETELDRQIYPDGVHVSRNPMVLPPLLADLLSLRQTYAALDQPVPKALFNAIDRMLPALRFFRHADGAVALFNGASVSEAHAITALLRYDETLGEPMSMARQAGYQRLAAGGTVLLADTGSAPRAELAGQAHAGALSFEFSSGGHRFVVNCGGPGRDDEEWRRIARTTAAHSTVTVAETSSARFARSPFLERFVGTPLVSGPSNVPVEQTIDAGSLGFVASHDGYAGLFGLLHERQVRLSVEGDRIEGIDRLLAAPRRTRASASRGDGAPLSAALRFHLHPGVHVTETRDGVRLATRGEVWHFESSHEFRIEDSVFFADNAGARRTAQIVVDLDARPGTEAAWRFRREAGE